MYYAGGYDNEGEPEDIVENLGPWDAVQSSAEALAGNKAATRLLKVCKVTVEQTEFGAFVRNANGMQITSREMPVFKRPGRNGR